MPLQTDGRIWRDRSDWRGRSGADCRSCREAAAVAQTVQVVYYQTTLGDAFGVAGARSFAVSPAMSTVFLPFRNTDLRCVAFGECPPSLAAGVAAEPMGGKRSE